MDYSTAIMLWCIGFAMPFAIARFIFK